MIRPGLRRSGMALVTALLCMAATGGVAQTVDDNRLSVELNKVETTDVGCQTYFVIHNRSGYDFDRIGFEVVLFDTDDVIIRRLRFDVAPLRNGRRDVLIFVIDPSPCERIGQILFDNFPDCRTAGGDIACLDIMELSSRAPIRLGL
jgi:hypothetical protein